MDMANGDHCPLCAAPGGHVVWQGGEYRIVIAEDAPAPVLRVIWNAHIREMSDLDAAGRRTIMAAVLAAEESLRALLDPDKINLASLGNQVPHLHWHVIARFRGDSWFPDSLWSAAHRPAIPWTLDPRAVEAALKHRLG